VFILGVRESGGQPPSRKSNFPSFRYHPPQASHNVIFQSSLPKLWDIRARFIQQPVYQQVSPEWVIPFSLGPFCSPALSPDALRVGIISAADKVRSSPAGV
jgi:hypothetical protein